MKGFRDDDDDESRVEQERVKVKKGNDQNLGPFLLHSNPDDDSSWFQVFQDLSHGDITFPSFFVWRMIMIIMKDIRTCETKSYTNM